MDEAPINITGAGSRRDDAAPRALEPWLVARRAGEAKRQGAVAQQKAVKERADDRLRPSQDGAESTEIQGRAQGFVREVQFSDRNWWQNGVIPVSTEFGATLNSQTLLKLPLSGRPPQREFRSHRQARRLNEVERHSTEEGGRRSLSGLIGFRSSRLLKNVFEASR